jgi:cytoskeletal protein CcmA (bactofilin family)
MSCINTNAVKKNATRFAGLLLPCGSTGSAIVLVVSVGALVTLLVFTWVAFSVRRSHAVIAARDRLRARYAAESVISTAVYGRIKNPAGRQKRDSTVIVRTGDSASRVIDDSSCIYLDSAMHSKAEADLEEEGSFLRVTAKGSSGSARCAIRALFGLELPAEYRYALVLSPQTARPLEIRRGRIIGDLHAAVPPAGGVLGAVHTGIGQMPTVAENKFEEEINRLNEKIRYPEKAEVVLQGNQAFSGDNPPPLHAGKDLFVNGHLMLESTPLRPLIIKGPVTIIAAGDLQISGSVSAEDAELIALGKVQCFDNVRLHRVKIYSQSAVYLGDHARCDGCLYAFQNVTIAGQAAVEMPAFAYVRGMISKDPAKSSSGFQLVDEARFTGITFCKEGITTSMIGRDARFTGLFYSRGHLILEGTVFGCVVATSLKESPESDRNMLAGGTINRKVLPRNFTVPLAFGRPGATFRLVSWEEEVKRSGQGSGKREQEARAAEPQRHNTEPEGM